MPDQQHDNFDADMHRVLDIARQMETKETDSPPISNKLLRWLGNVLVFILITVILIVLRLGLGELLFNLF